MKKTVLLFVMLLLSPAVCQAGRVDVYVAGKNVKELEAQDALWIAAGCLADYGVHELSHVIALELTGADYSYHDMSFYFKSDSNSERQWVGRAGFLGETAVNLLLSFSKWDQSAFHTGFSLSATLRPLTYGLFFDTGNGRGDFNTIEKGDGNPDLERAIYTIANGAMTTRLIQVRF